MVKICWENISQVLLKRGSIWHDIAHITAGTEARYQSEAKPIKYTPYLGLTGQLWGVFREYLGENWPRFNSITLSVFIFAFDFIPQKWCDANCSYSCPRKTNYCQYHRHIDGLVQGRRNSSALAMELRPSCTNPSILSKCTLPVDNLAKSWWIFSAMFFSDAFFGHFNTVLRTCNVIKNMINFSFFVICVCFVSSVKWYLLWLLSFCDTSLPTETDSGGPFVIW